MQEYQHLFFNPDYGHRPDVKGVQTVYFRWEDVLHQSAGRDDIGTPNFRPAKSVQCYVPGLLLSEKLVRDMLRQALCRWFGEATVQIHYVSLLDLPRYLPSWPEPYPHPHPGMAHPSRLPVPTNQEESLRRDAYQKEWNEKTADAEFIMFIMTRESWMTDALVQCMVDGDGADGCCTLSLELLQLHAPISARGMLEKVFTKEVVVKGAGEGNAAQGREKRPKEVHGPFGVAPVGSSWGKQRNGTDARDGQGTKQKQKTIKQRRTFYAGRSNGPPILASAGGLAPFAVNLIKLLIPGAVPGGMPSLGVVQGWQPLGSISSRHFYAIRLAWYGQSVDLLRRAHGLEVWRVIGGWTSPEDGIKAMQAYSSTAFRQRIDQLRLKIGQLETAMRTYGCAKMQSGCVLSVPIAVNGMSLLQVEVGCDGQVNMNNIFEHARQLDRLRQRIDSLNQGVVYDETLGHAATQAQPAGADAAPSASHRPPSTAAIRAGRTDAVAMRRTVTAPGELRTSVQRAPKGLPASSTSSPARATAMSVTPIKTNQASAASGSSSFAPNSGGPPSAGPSNNAPPLSHTGAARTNSKTGDIASPPMPDSHRQEAPATLVASQVNDDNDAAWWARIDASPVLALYRMNAGGTSFSISNHDGDWRTFSHGNWPSDSRRRAAAAAHGDSTGQQGVAAQSSAINETGPSGGLPLLNQPSSSHARHQAPSVRIPQPDKMPAGAIEGGRNETEAIDLTGDDDATHGGNPLTGEEMDAGASAANTGHPAAMKRRRSVHALGDDSD